MKQLTPGLIKNLKSICDDPEFIQDVERCIYLLLDEKKKPKPKKPSEVKAELDRFGRAIYSLSREAMNHLSICLWGQSVSYAKEALLHLHRATKEPLEKLDTFRVLFRDICNYLAEKYNIPIVQTENSKLAWLIEIICEEIDLHYNPFQIIKEIREEKRYQEYLISLMAEQKGQN